MPVEVADVDTLAISVMDDWTMMVVGSQDCELVIVLVAWMLVTGVAEIVLLVDVMVGVSEEDSVVVSGRVVF